MAGRQFKSLLSIGSVLIVLLSVLSGTDAVAKEKKPQAADKTIVSNLEATTISPEDLKFFNAKILPVLAHRCYKCHSHKSKELEASLYLDSRAGWAKGGENGPAINPGNPEKSRLIKALRYNVKGIEGMPEDGKLKPEVIKDFEEWVRRGAPDPRKAFKSDIKKSLWKEDFKERRAKHWAWQPLVAKDPGPVKDKAWARTKIDRYLLARLEAKGLKPAKPADKNTLIRRVTFDVIGLPPTPEEIDAFLKDNSPQAFEKVVDRLLASGHFGERWARHWMDLVRYAESYGHEFDYPIHNPYLYRDYLIRALNADISYKQFVIEAIAGDLVDPPRLHPKKRFNESVIGTGFWYLGEAVHSPVDILQDESDRVDNQIDVMTRTFQGLTVGCARCHDHKFDAISSGDYYALKGFLQSSSQQHAEIDSPMEFRKARDQILALDRQRKDKVLKMFATQQRRAFAPLSKYLLSAREILLPAESKPLSVLSAAKKFGVDGARLERWVAYLKKAAADPLDPFYAWATLAIEKPDASKNFEARVRAVLDRLVKKQSEADEALKKVTIVEDFTMIRPEDWLPVGRAFTAGPDRAGNMVFGTTAAKPIELFNQRGTGRSDLISPKIKGLLRTKTFEITANKLWYYSAGSAKVFLTVDSHRIINGPLHKVVNMKINSGKKFAWKSHNVKDYIGHRVHVEFTPQGYFAIGQLQLTDGKPVDVQRPNQQVIRMLADGKITSAEILARQFQILLSKTINLAEAGQLANSPNAADSAKFANWLIQHGDLLETVALEATKEKQFETDHRAYTAERARLVQQIPASRRTVLALADGSSENEYIYIRGKYQNRGTVVKKRFLTAISSEKQTPITKRSGRMELARRMTDPSNPLLSRVMVNRIWQHLFGEGIVRTPDNFGALGKTPTHPLLLDHLALEFTKKNWSIKSMIRSIALSNTYQMSSKPDAQNTKIDPGNLLLHRTRIRRLESEIIRDSILAVSGRLDKKMFGPSVPVYLTEHMTGRGRPKGGPLDGAGRRSVYISVRRNFLSPMMLSFGTPIPFSTMGRREEPNVPAQALILMNNPFVIQQAKLWSKRVLADKNKTSPGERITDMVRTAYAREPSPTELADMLAFVKQQSSEYGKPNDPRVWADLCHILFNVKEFIYIN